MRAPAAPSIRCWFNTGREHRFYGLRRSWSSSTPVPFEENNLATLPASKRLRGEGSSGWRLDDASL